MDHRRRRGWTCLVLAISLWSIGMPFVSWSFSKMTRATVQMATTTSSDADGSFGCVGEGARVAGDIREWVLVGLHAGGFKLTPFYALYCSAIPLNVSAPKSPRTDQDFGKMFNIYLNLSYPDLPVLEARGFNLNQGYSFSDLDLQLVMAVRDECMETVDALLGDFLEAEDARANPSACVFSTNEPLFVAAGKGNVEMVRRLLEAGASADELAKYPVPEDLDDPAPVFFNESKGPFLQSPVSLLAEKLGHLEVCEALRQAERNPSQPEYQLVADTELPGAKVGSLREFDTLGNVTLSVPSFADFSKPMWAWTDQDREEWLQQNAAVKARLLAQEGLEPLPSMEKRVRSSGVSIHGAPQPEEATNLNPCPSPATLSRLEDCLASFFGQHVGLTPGGSSSRLTDLPESDWDFYLEVPGVLVTTDSRDRLVRHLHDTCDFETNLSERGIAIQVQVNSTLIELVPRNASYFEWEDVQFPLFLGSSNRSKIEADLLEYLQNNEGARLAIRELKAAFPERIPSFLVEHLVKRMALKSVVIYMNYHGFVYKLRLPEAFDLLCHILEELATYENRPSRDPFSPVQDLLADLEVLPPDRGKKIQHGLKGMATLAKNNTWANRFLLHVEFLMNAQQHSFLDVQADPTIVEPAHTAYSLFIEYQLGREKLQAWQALGEPPKPTPMLDKGNLLTLQFDPDDRKATPARPVKQMELSDYVDFHELQMDIWEASMRWWNMSTLERQPWKEMHQFQHQNYLAKVKDIRSQPGVPHMKHPLRLFRTSLCALRDLRKFEENFVVDGLMVNGKPVGDPVGGLISQDPALDLMLRLRVVMMKKLYSEQMQRRFQESPFARHSLSSRICDGK